MGSSWNMRGWSRIGAACAVLGASVAVAACGDSSSSGSSSDSSNAGKSASPVTIGMFTSTGSAISYPTTDEGAKLAVAGINQRGGLAGHPIKFMLCNSGVDPNLAVSCARKFVQAKVSAVVGQAAIADASATPVLQAAKIPVINGAPRAPQSQNSPISFEFAPPSPLQYSVGAAYGIAGRHKKTAIVLQDSSAGAAFGQLMTKTLKGFNLNPTGVILASPTAPDYAPLVAKAKSQGAQAIMFAVTVPQSQQFIKAANAAGANFDYLAAGAMTKGDADSIGGLDVLARQYGVQPYPSLNPSATDPVTKQYSADMGSHKDLVAETSDASQAWAVWLSYYIFDQAIKQSGTKDVSAAGITKAFQTVKNVKLGLGMPAWTPGQASTPQVAKISFSQRVSNPNLIVVGHDSSGKATSEGGYFNAIDGLGGKFPAQ